MLFGKIFAWGLGLVIALAIAGFVYQFVSVASYDRVRPGQLISIAGRDMHLLCLGEHPGPTVILETGGGNSSITSRAIQSRISEFANVCAYDRAGYGFSDPVDSARTFDEISNDLNLLLTTAGIAPPFILVGESMGGLLVRNYYRHHPDNVAGVLLLDAAEEEHTYGRLDELKKIQSIAFVSSHLARFGVVRLMFAFAPEKLGVPAGTSPERIRELAADYARPSFFKASVDEMEAYFAAPEKMRKAGGFGALGATPLVVVTHGRAFTGPQSFLEEGWSEAQGRLSSLSTNSKLLVAQQSGHAIGLDQPDLVVDLVRELVEGTAAPD